MNHPLPNNGQAYPSNYLHNTSNPQHSAASSTTRPPGHGILASAPSGLPALPPLAPPSYVSTPHPHDAFACRGPYIPPSHPTSGTTPLHQPGAGPVYGPTSTTYFPSPGHAIGYSQTPPAASSYRTSAPQYSAIPPPQNTAYQTSSQPIKLQELRPMPLSSMNATDLSLSKNGRSIASATPLTEDTPKHVVGSQGRRGILPSATGRPPAIGDNGVNAQKGVAAPAKDAEGKYPCEHCPKTYLHAKHLKRHMLRHTGVRPYTCGLCRDTFSRSDILKRHFQKCSQRRGNPTGESHLSHSRNNKKIKAEGEEISSTENTHTHTPTDPSHPSSAFASTGFDGSVDIRPLEIGQSNFPEGQASALNQLSRSNSMRKKPSRNSSNRDSITAVPASTYETGNFGYNSTGHITPESVTTSGAATPYPFPNEPRSNNISPDATTSQATHGLGLPNGSAHRPPALSQFSGGNLPHIVGQSNGRGQEVDWNTYHNFHHSQEDFGSSHYNANMTPNHFNQKSEPDFTAPIQPNLFNFQK